MSILSGSVSTADAASAMNTTASIENKNDTSPYVTLLSHNMELLLVNNTIYSEFQHQLSLSPDCSASAAVSPVANYYSANINQKFQSTEVPDISLEHYIQRIRKHSNCSDSCFILCLIYICRIIENIHHGTPAAASLSVASPPHHPHH